MAEVIRREFMRLMTERRGFAVGSPDHAYRTSAGRKLVWLAMGKPVMEWTE